MSLLPENTQLGKLELVEVYEYYDRPLLFVCKNELSHLFLVLYDGEQGEEEQWIYAPISQNRFESIRSGGIDLHDAFADAEQGFVYHFIVSKGGIVHSEDIILNHQLADERLPDRGEFLNFRSESLPKLQDITVQSRQMNRDIVHLRLEYSDKSLHEAPARQLGRILTALQGLVDRLAQQTNQLYKEGTKLPKGLLGAVELAVTDVGAGSFEVELASPVMNKIDMFDREVLSNALDALVKLIQIDANVDEINQALGELRSPQIAQQYLNFLTSIKSNVDTTELEWASSIGRSGKVNITSPRVFAMIDVLKMLTEKRTNRLEFVGVLLGFDVKDRSFRMDWVDKETIIRGKASDDVTVEDFEFMSKVTLSKRYRAIVLEEIIYKVATDDEKRSYSLVKLSDI